MDHDLTSVDVDADFRLPLALVGSLPARARALQPTFLVRPEGVYVFGRDRLARCSLDLRVLHWERPMVGGESLLARGDALFVVRAAESQGGVTIVDTATGARRGDLDIPGDAKIVAVTTDAGRLLIVSQAGSWQAIDVRSGRALWTRRLPVRDRWWPVTAAVGTVDAFVVAPAATEDVMCLEAASGLVRWRTPLPESAAEIPWERACWGLVPLGAGSLVCRTGAGAMLRLAEADGQAQARRESRGGRRWLISGDHVFEFDYGFMRVFDVATFKLVADYDWSASWGHGQRPYVDEFVVSRRSIVYTASGQLHGVYWPGKRGGRRRVWTYPRAAAGVTGVQASGGYVYGIGWTAGVGGELYCFESADRTTTSPSTWSRPWRRPEQRRRRQGNERVNG